MDNKIAVAIILGAAVVGFVAGYVIVMRLVMSF